MKRRTCTLPALILSAVLCGVTLTACGSKTEPKPAEIPAETETEAETEAPAGTDGSAPAEETPAAEETAAPVKPTEPEEPMKDFVPVFRCIFCSDTHVSSIDSTTGKRLGDMFRQAYAYSDSHPTYNTVDAVAVAGDLTNSGNPDELKAFNAVVKKNIREEETQLITVMGNHEYYGGGQKAYKENRCEDLDVHEVVKGFHFIGLSTNDSSGTYTSAQIKWLEGELEAAAADDPDKPIFTFQHHHLKNTVYVSRSWYTDCTAQLNKAFKKYPQVMNFSGHSHGPVNNPISVWQEDYSLFGTGTLNYFEMEVGMTAGTVPEGSGNAAQFYFIEVDKDNRVRVLPYNMLTEDFFRTPSGTDDPDKQLVYVIDDLKNPDTFLYTPDRYDNATAPRFAEGASLTVSDIRPDGAKITVPQALDDSCLYSYRAVCKDENGKKVSEFKFFSEYYFEPMPETVDYRASGLDENKTYTVEVYPVNIWKLEGEPLTVQFTTTSYPEIEYESKNPVNFKGTFTNFDSMKRLTRSSGTPAYGGKIEGDVFGGQWDGAEVYRDVELTLEEGKGYEGSAALGITSTASSHANRCTYVFPTDANGNPVQFPRFGYLRVWVDFTGVSFRKACFGLLDSSGSLYSTDDFDNRSDQPLYYLAEGSDSWKTLYHGGDGCFGEAQDSSVRDFRGWLAVPVKDFGSRSGDGGAFSGIGISGFYMYWDFSEDSMLGTQFYLDEIQLVPDYTVFEK